ncbi:hypothetical protein [Sphingomonas sp. M1-B02]|uniref:hypothetical protein n=1 Tax=Sphingomonas sp. M1-B02 TaxID=3114300 RepID=UPI00223F2330|nr:hypothetical protein [Sphingomonas sp. S6-11]UZK66956.1 hypothetical protein OKW87_03755 [Sphingomonas sp. S6-11]
MFESLFLILAASGAQAADPLAPAREGKIQCIAPNKEKKTCMGTATYTVRPDGSYDSVVVAMIAPAPLITMETRSSGKVEDGAVCGLVRSQDYAASKFSVDGKPADAATAEAIKGQVLGAIASMDGKNGCARDRVDGDLVAVEVTLDGVARPELNQKISWVKPEEGYKIGQ